MSDPRAAQGTVSRFAWLLGWAVGIGICVGGYYTVGALALRGGSGPLVEFGFVVVAFAATFGIWKLSARPGRQDLDSPPGAPDRDAP